MIAYGHLFSFKPILLVMAFIGHSFLSDVSPADSERTTQSKFTVNDDLYSLEISLERVEDNVYDLVAVIDFKEDGYTASPMSDKNYTGAFKMDLSRNPNVSWSSDLEETPNSQQLWGLKDQEPGDWIRERTTYSRVFRVYGNQDFDAGGKISFTIEPRCTFEEIPLMLKQQAGVLTLQSWGC